jgi:hypothetical protein
LTASESDLKSVTMPVCGGSLCNEHLGTPDVWRGVGGFEDEASPVRWERVQLLLLLSKLPQFFLSYSSCSSQCSTELTYIFPFLMCSIVTTPVLWGGAKVDNHVGQACEEQQGHVVSSSLAGEATGMMRGDKAKTYLRCL